MPPEYASKDAVDSGFKAAAERFTGFEMELEEARDCIKQLQSQLRRAHAYALPGDGVGASNKFWPSEEMAKEFGECVLQAIGKKALEGGVPSGGGVLVPDELARRFVDLLSVYGKFRKNATVLSMNSASALIPELKTDMAVTCPGEGKLIDKSSPTFGQIRLSPKTWASLCAISQEISEDSVLAVAEIVGVSIARSMARQEDRVGFLGDGSETYFGMTGICGKFQKMIADHAGDEDPSIAGVVVQATPGNWTKYDLEDFDSMAERLPDEADQGARFYCSKAFYFKVMRRIAIALGSANMFELLSDRKARFFNGYEVETVSCMPRTAAGGQISCLLGDLRLGAYLAQRLGLNIQRSDDVYFGTYQIGIRGIERIDINCFGTGSKTSAGPIVALLEDDGE